MRALIAAGDVFAAARIRAMLAKENLVCDATDLGRDSLLLGRLYDYDLSSSPWRGQISKATSYCSSYAQRVCTRRY